MTLPDLGSIQYHGNSVLLRRFIVERSPSIPRAFSVIVSSLENPGNMTGVGALRNFREWERGHDQEFGSETRASLA